MIRSELLQIIGAAIEGLMASNVLQRIPIPEIELSDCREATHGDFSTNVAMVYARAWGKPPREVATLVAETLARKPEFNAVEIAGPGFLNFRLEKAYVAGQIAKILSDPQVLSKSSLIDVGSRQKVNVEFVSVNPNGPITVGSGRGAAYGSALCNVLVAVGHTVHREYYINDGTNSEQMRLFAESVKAIVEGDPLPDNGYKGDYVNEVAAHAKRQLSIEAYQQASQELMLRSQKLDLETFGVLFDTWFSEQSLHANGTAEVQIDALRKKGVADEEPFRTVLTLAKGGAIAEARRESQLDDGEEDRALQERTVQTLWLRSTKFGDDMDRVLRRKDGRLTYIASDVAYHFDKLHDASGTRGTGPVDRMITILGPDHHGYIHRLRAVVGALLERVSNDAPAANAEPLTETESVIYRSVEEREACKVALLEAQSRLEVVIFQIVRFMKDGQPVLMRKRDGNFYTLNDLVIELGRTIDPHGDPQVQTRIGRDVARFFYLMRSHETHMDFDIDLATQQSDDNPVFYVQYAHARICTLLDKARDVGMQVPDEGAFDASVLVHPKELDLVKCICELPNELQRCARDYGVHRLTTYSIELARSFHHFYDQCRVIDPGNLVLSQARLALSFAARQALRDAFGIIGISAPERMHRAEEPARSNS